MYRIFFILAMTASLWAADAQFNGWWDIRVPDHPQKRASWMEITGAGTPALKGRFVGFPGGDMNTIENLTLKDGVLRFIFEMPARGKSAGLRYEYTAKLVGGRLKGMCNTGKREMAWTGERAPQIDEHDDGSWREAKPIRLFNGKDLAGWQGIMRGGQLGWSVKDGLLTASGSANNLESERKYWNYLLHVEYRVGPKSNSGIGLRGRYEIQILDDYGAAPDTHSNGSLYSRIAPSVAAGKPAGEWQTYDIRLVGRDLTVVLNGKQVVKGLIEGLTAMATDPEEGKPGPITLQGDHGPVEFREIVLTPLVKK